jgi:hypothetical protein
MFIIGRPTNVVPMFIIGRPTNVVPMFIIGRPTNVVPMFIIGWPTIKVGTTRVSVAHPTTTDHRPADRKGRPHTVS